MQDKEFEGKNLLQVILQNAALRNQWEKEVGDFTRENHLSKELYSNDLRHQYAAAITARNLGEDKTRMLGNMNEMVNFSGGDKLDREIDKFNNEIGIKYGLNYPLMSKQQLLEQLYNDHSMNRETRKQQLGY